jgi:hypothetical protein
MKGSASAYRSLYACLLLLVCYRIICFQIVNKNRSKKNIIISISILGPFNSGTNLLKKQLVYLYSNHGNYHNEDISISICDGNQKIPQCEHIPWKHAPPWRLPTKTTSHQSTDFTIAIVRNPYSWMKSMRITPYDLHCAWGPRSTCHLARHPYFETFGSLPAVWNQYYGEYLAREARNFYLIKYENMVLNFQETFSNLSKAISNHAIRVLQKENSANLSMINVHAPPLLNNMPVYRGKAKLHGRSKNWNQASKSLQTHSYLKDYTKDDLSWSCIILNSSLMLKFGYQTCSEIEYTSIRE